MVGLEYKIREKFNILGGLFLGSGIPFFYAYYGKNGNNNLLFIPSAFLGIIGLRIGFYYEDRLRGNRAIDLKLSTICNSINRGLLNGY